MAGIKGVLFDKDGTLLEFNKTWGPAAHAVIETLTQGDTQKRQALTAIVGFVPGTMDLDPQAALVSAGTDDYGREWARVLGRPATPAFFAEIDAHFAAAVLKSLAPIAQAQPALARLHHRNLPMGLATNDAELNARQQMAALDFSRFMPFIAGYDSGFGGKPDPGMVLAFARARGLAAGEVVLVGDTLHDMHAARNAGARAVAVLTGVHGKAARPLLQGHADIIIDTLDELDDALMAL
ncbi:MAG: HAD family hydrolase [Beijerinckiaceae bacterium]